MEEKIYQIIDENNKNIPSFKYKKKKKGFKIAFIMSFSSIFAIAIVCIISISIITHNDNNAAINNISYHVDMSEDTPTSKDGENYVTWSDANTQTNVESKTTNQSPSSEEVLSKEDESSEEDNTEEDNIEEDLSINSSSDEEII